MVVRFPALEAVGPGYDGVERYYDLEWSSNVLLANWPPVAGFSNILGRGQLVQHTNSGPGQAYFRGRARLE